MQIYLVGGAIRDRLLNIAVEERDWVVVGATIPEMVALGYRQLDAVFPVFAHPETGEEYALARREQKTAPGHKGFSVHTGTDVTLSEDLERRDLTINAMAQDADGTIVDPFNGRADLAAGILRHVSPAFAEDPLRVLRAARFLAHLAHLGFTVTAQTREIMQRMATAGELESLSRERFWKECERALREPSPVAFFHELLACHALEHLFPELACALGPADESVRQDSPLAALSRATALSPEPGIRYAALCAAASLRADGEEAAANLQNALCAPAGYRELTGTVVNGFPIFQSAGSAGAEDLLAGLEKLDAFRKPDRFHDFLVACQAIAGTAAPVPESRLTKAYQAASAVHAADIADSSIEEGKKVGEALRMLRRKAIAQMPD